MSLQEKTMIQQIVLKRAYNASLFYSDPRHGRHNIAILMYEI